MTDTNCGNLPGAKGEIALARKMCSDIDLATVLGRLYSAPQTQMPPTLLKLMKNPHSVGVWMYRFKSDKWGFTGLLTVSLTLNKENVHFLHIQDFSQCELSCAVKE